MIVLYPYCQSDEPLAVKNAKWLMSLKNDVPLRIVLVKDDRCGSTVDAIFGEKVVKTVKVKDRHNEWPQSCNTMFSEAARFMEYFLAEEKYWLWLEPDAVPLKDGWLDAIVAEHVRGKKRFTGAYIPGAPGQDHLSGIAVYPNPLVIYAGLMLSVDDEPIPFDLADGPNVVRQSNLTDLIQNRPRKAVRNGDKWVRTDEEQRFKSLEDFYKVATKECVLFHSDKHGDLCDLFENLRSQHGDNKKSVSEPARLSTDELPKPATQTTSNGETFYVRGDQTIQDHVAWLKQYAAQNGFARARVIKELKRNKLTNVAKIHGCKGTPIYSCYRDMLTRCYNSKFKDYSRYGGRGIKICERWISDFTYFLEDMGEKPLGKTLGRINNDGNYCPENCRWETISEQAHNRNSSRFLTIGPETKIYADWAKVFGITHAGISWRAKHWTPEKWEKELIKAGLRQPKELIQAGLREKKKKQ